MKNKKTLNIFYIDDVTNIYMIKKYIYDKKIKGSLNRESYNKI